MAKLAGVIVGGYLTWIFGFTLAELFGSWWIVGLLIPFGIGYMVAASTVEGILLSLTRGGILSSAMMRPVKGFFADVLMWLLTGWLFFRLYVLLSMYFPVTMWRFSEKAFQAGSLTWISSLVLAASVISLCSRNLKITLGRVTRPVRRIVHSIRFGQGGSSKFHGMLEEWSNPWKPGMLLLGTSLYSRGWKVGVRDDRHFITVATSRSGKGRSGIIPNLLTWPGSAVVIDPKGQNAAVTMLSRIHKGQSVYVVDPFRSLEQIGAMPGFRTYYRFNPLSEIDPDAIDVVEQCGNIADALVKPDPHSQAFFIESAQQVLKGLVAHVVTSRYIPDDQRTLITVRKLVGELYDESPLIGDMRQNDQAAGLAIMTVAFLETLGDRARGDVLGTVNQQTQWLDSLAMHDCLSASEFTLANLKSDLVTVYLVLPPEHLNTHGRFLRLFINLTLSVASKGRKPQHSVLFILDEFYALGPMRELSTSAGLLAGFGVKLWPIVQNLGQLQELYPNNWETFLGNAGLWQVFAANDESTARYLSERLGQHITWRKVRGQDGKTEWDPQGATLLRSPVEFAQESSRESGNQVVFQEGGAAFLLRRAPYDKMFKRNEYVQDPFEPAPRGLAAIGGIWRLPAFLIALPDLLLDEWQDRRADRKEAAARLAPPGKRKGL